MNKYMTDQNSFSLFASIWSSDEEIHPTKIVLVYLLGFGAVMRKFTQYDLSDVIINRYVLTELLSVCYLYFFCFYDM